MNEAGGDEGRTADDEESQVLLLGLDLLHNGRSPSEQLVNLTQEDQRRRGRLEPGHQRLVRLVEENTAGYDEYDGCDLKW